MAKPFLDGRLLSAVTRAPSSGAFTSDFIASYAVDVKTFSFSLANYHLKCHWRCFMRGTVTSCDGASTIRSTSKRWRWRWWLSRCFTSNICETILFRFHFSPPCFVFRRATRFSHFFHLSLAKSLKYLRSAKKLSQTLFVDLLTCDERHRAGRNKKIFTSEQISVAYLGKFNFHTRIFDRWLGFDNSAWAHRHFAGDGRMIEPRWNMAQWMLRNRSMSH